MQLASETADDRLSRQRARPYSQARGSRQSSVEYSLFVRCIDLFQLLGRKFGNIRYLSELPEEPARARRSAKRQRLAGLGLCFGLQP